MTGYTFEEITKTEPEKRLITPLKKTGGRANTGQRSVQHIGGGNKKFYRIIDFKRDKDNIEARVQAIEYDPNRSCRIALLAYKDGEKRYILCPEGLKVGDVISSGQKVEPRVGCAMPIKGIPIGMNVHNIELEPGRGGKFCRSAGTFAQLLAKEGNYAVLLLPSREMRKISVHCRATIGQIGNSEHILISLGKAGRKRHMGVRPTVRGVAMNPVSHPMGGGVGRKVGRPPISKYGKQLAKGGKTRNPRKNSSKFIIRRRPEGPHYAQKG